MLPEFGCRSGKCNYDGQLLLSLITEWNCWKLHDIGGPEDLIKGVCKHKL